MAGLQLQGIAGVRALGRPGTTGNSSPVTVQQQAFGTSTSTGTPGRKGAFSLRNAFTWRYGLGLVGLGFMVWLYWQLPE